MKISILPTIICIEIIRRYFMYHADTFVKLNRKILDWKWYQDGTTFRVFIHLILKANVFDNDFQNITVHRGQLVTSYGCIADDLGFYKNSNINVEPIRTAIRHLKKTGEITTKRIQKGLLITINNYEKYQGEVMQNNQENFSAPNENTMETKSEPNHFPIKTQQYNKLNKYNKSYKSKTERQKLLLPPLGLFENVFLTEKEKQDLESKYPKTYQGKIDRLSRYLVNSRKKYVNHYAVLLGWLEEDKEIDESNILVTKNSSPTSEMASYNIDELENYSMFD